MEPMAFLGYLITAMLVAGAVSLLVGLYFGVITDNLGKRLSELDAKLAKKVEGKKTRVRR